AAYALEYHAHSGCYLARTKWLDHVVVGPDLQAYDTIDLFAARGKEEYRNVGRLADEFTHFEATQIGQANVQNDELHTRFQSCCNTLCTQADPLYTKALTFERED